MSEYNITFNTSESENRLSKVIQHLNTIGQQADRLDNRHINLGAKVNQEEVKGLKQELGRLFSGHLTQAASTFSTHMENMEKTTERMTNDVGRLTNALQKNRRQIQRNTKSNKSAVRSLHSGAQATAVWRAGLNAAGTSMGIFTSQTILAASAAYGLVSTFRASVTAGVEFSDVMARVQAVTGSSAETLDWMKEEVRGFAGTTIFTAKEAADALLQLGMAGLSAEESVAAMPATLRLASIGLMSAGEAADLATNVMTQFGLEASQLTAVVDDLATVANNSNTTISQLGNALTYAGPAAQSANVHITELTAAVGTLASAGIKSSRAGTAMRRVIQMLVAPSDKAQKTLAKLGVATQDLQGNVRPLADVLEDLKNAGVDYADAVELVTLRQSQGFLALVNSTDKYKELEQRQKDNTDAAKEFQKTIEDTLGADFKLLVSAAYEKMLQFFDLNEDGFRTLVQSATEFVKAIDVNKLNDTLTTIYHSVTKIGTALALLWAGGKAGKLIVGLVGLSGKLSAVTVSATAAATATGGFSAALGVLRAAVIAHPVGLIATALAGGVYWLIQAQEETKTLNDRLKDIDPSLVAVKQKIDEERRALEKRNDVVKESQKLTETDIRRRINDAIIRQKELSDRKQELALRVKQAKVEERERSRTSYRKDGYDPSMLVTGKSHARSEAEKELAGVNKELSNQREILAVLNRSLLDTEEYTDVTEKSLSDAGDAYVAFTEKVEKFRNQKMEASKAVKQHKKALTAANEAIKSYDKSLTSANKQLERDYRFKKRTVQLEVEMHQLRMSNLAEYQRKEEEALRQRKANFDKYAAKSRGEYVGENGSLTQVNREIAKEEEKRKKMAEKGPRGEKYPAEEELMKLYERQKKLQQELAALDEENAAQRAKLGQEEIDLQEAIRQKHLELGDQKVNSLARYAEGLISEAELIRRVEAAQEKYNKALKEAQKLKGSDRSAAIQKAEADYAEDMSNAAGTFAEKFAYGMEQRLNGLGQTMADAAASGDYSRVGLVLGQTLASSLGGAFSDPKVGNAFTQVFSNAMAMAAGGNTQAAGMSLAGAGIGAAIGGPVGAQVGSMIGGMLAGGKEEKTGTGYKLDFNNSSLTSAQTSESFSKNRSFFRGTSRWTEYADIVGSELEELVNTLGNTTDSVAVDARALGIELEDFSGTIENKSGNLEDAIEEYANKLADSNFAAIEKFQLMGESAADTFSRLADTANRLTEGFKQTGRGSDIRSAYMNEYSKSLTSEYMTSLRSETEELADLQAELDYWRDKQTLGLSAGLEKYRKIEDLESKIAAAQDRLAEVRSRLAGVDSEAAAMFDSVFDKTLAKLNNVKMEEVEALSQDLLQSFFDSYFTAQEQLRIQIDNAKREFDEMGVSGITLDSTAEEVRALYEGASDPARIAEILSAADALARYNEAIRQSNEIEIGSLENNLKDLRALSDAIQDTLSAISGETFAAKYARAQQEIKDTYDQSLAGDIPLLADIQDALSVVESATADQFASFADYAFEQAKTANYLLGLKDVTDDQMTVEEQSLEQLKQINAKLSGETTTASVPGFATGGMHQGGIRLVGEREPELEVTGPARYYNQRQMQSLMSGSDSNQQVVYALQELRGIILKDTDNTDRMQRILQKWDLQGQPVTRDELV